MSCMKGILRGGWKTRARLETRIVFEDLIMLWSRVRVKENRGIGKFLHKGAEIPRSISLFIHLVSQCIVSVGPQRSGKKLKISIGFPSFSFFWSSFLLAFLQRGYI